MGNSNAKNPKLKIEIETQKQFYNSGSCVEGVVFVHAEQNFPFDALYIRVQGDQYCQWFEGSSKNRRKYTGNENFYVMEDMLCKYNNSTLQQGKYSYPFSLELSENIPGSFSSDEYDAKIQYKLVAYFANFHNGNLRQHHQIPLIIREPFRQEACEYEGSVTTCPVTCWCCSQGEVYMKVRFGKNVSFEGEKVLVELEADNTNGQGPITDFVIELVQYTFVSANSGICRTYRKVIFKDSFKQNLQKGDKINIPIQHEFRIPEVPDQTAISTLVANYYRLEVFADIANISIDQPNICSPLFVLKEKFSGLGKDQLEIKAQEYQTKAKKQIKAPEYWFRKNKSLEVMNFRLEDGINNTDKQGLID